jgi:pilus assembly protein CpaB
VSRPGRRRRALLLLALALACGGLAASQVQQRVRAVEGRVGPLVPVAVAARDLPAEAELDRGAVAVRRVPARFVPPDALVAAAEVAGLRADVPIRAGSYLTAGLFAGGRSRGAGGLRRGERAVEIAVAGGGALAGAGPGTRVDLLVSTEPRDGEGRTLVAMEDVELLGLSAGSGGADPGAGSGGVGADPGVGAGGGASAAATAVATLRVTLRQAVYLAAAENFAREIRLLVRPPGDRGRAGRFGVGAGEL